LKIQHIFVGDEAVASPSSPEVIENSHIVVGDEFSQKQNPNREAHRKSKTTPGVFYRKGRYGRKGVRRKTLREGATLLQATPTGENRPLALTSVYLPLSKQSPKWGRIPHILRILLKIRGKPVAESVAERFFVAESVSMHGVGMEDTFNDFGVRFLFPIFVAGGTAAYRNYRALISDS